VRAALGVSEEELSDETLGLAIFSTELDEDLLTVHESVLPTWQALPDVDTQDADEKRFAALVGLYATYSVANHLINSSPNFSFLKVADGRASAERASDALLTLRANISGMLARVRARLLTALLVLVPGASIPLPEDVTVVSSVGIVLDPVTGA
jgi:hypothetical protein